MTTSRDAARSTVERRREFVVTVESQYGTHKVLRWAKDADDARNQIETANQWRYVTNWKIMDIRAAWPDLPPEKPNHLTWEECLMRYPRICALLADCLIESRSGAACCLRDYRDGLRFGSEAVSHSGLSPHDRVKQAMGRRDTFKTVWPEGYRRLLDDARIERLRARGLVHRGFHPPGYAESGCEACQMGPA